MLSRITRRTVLFAALLACLSAPLTAARADVLFSNFGSGSTDPFDISMGWSVANFDTGSEIAYARMGQMFTPSLNATLTSADIPMSFLYGSINSFTALVVGDNGGLPDDGNVLDSATVTDVVNGPIADIVNFSFNGGANLIAGNNYWLVVAPAGNDTLGGWAYNSTGQMGHAYAESSNGGWVDDPENTSSAFRINGTPSGSSAVPEGSTLALILPAIGAIVIAAARKHNNVFLISA